MGDENDDQEPDGEPKPPSGKQLRDKLEGALGENANLRRENLLLRSGLHDLPEDRQQAILRTFAKDEEVTADKMKAQAKSFGWLKEEGQGNPNPPPNGQQDPGTPPPNPTDTQDQTVASSIGELTAMEVAMIMAQRGTSDPTTVEDLSNKLRAAKSQAEVAQLVSQQGPHMGILMDSDID